MAYCTVADLMIGDISTSAALDPQKYVDDAADEIDSKIGFVYATPIPVADGSGTPRPVVLLLKRLNSHLATGRLILAATIPAENERLNAYGYSLVAEVMTSLDMIATRQMTLEGVSLEPTVGTVGEPVTVPLIANLDAESNVDAFYSRVTNPNGWF